MRVLGISGSPKKEGFTNILLNESLDGARAGGALTDKIILSDLTLKPCQECWKCEDGGGCVQSDGMDIVYKKINDADALIIASPIYFGTITAQAKIMIDRFNSLWVEKRRHKNDKLSVRCRKGAFICVAGGDRKEYFKNAKSVIRILFAILGMEYSKELFVDGLDKMTVNSAKKKRSLLKSYELGLSLAKPK